MIYKNLAWNTFRNTGNVETYIAMKELEMQENNLQNLSSKMSNIVNGGVNGDNKN